MRGSAAFRTGVAPGGALAGPWVRDPLWTRARAVPSLDLRFAENKSLVDATTGAQLVTFTRASSGTFVGSDGVLRTAVTNLLLQSEDLSTTWTNVNTSEAINVATAPDGTTTADKLITNNGVAGVSSYITQTVAKSAAATTYTYSAFAKTGDAGTGTLQLLAVDTATSANSATSSFSTVSGTITVAASVNGTFTNVSSIITPLADDWYRCSLTFTTGTETSINLRLYSRLPTTGDGTRGILLWGAQLEQSSTVGEYIPTTSTINSAPRFDHNPTTGESLGLLVEEARTNVVTWSQDLSNADWGKAAATIVSTAVASPIQGVNYQKIEATSANTTVGVTSIAVTAATQQRAISFFAQPLGNISRVLVVIQGIDARININLVDGTFTTNVIATGSTVSVFGQRFSVSTPTLTLATGVRFFLKRTGEIDTNTPTTIAIGEGLYLTGAQMEAGAFPTSYIPTVAATATRAADVASITGSNFSSWYNQTEGTVFANYAERAFSVTHQVATISNGTANERISFAINSSNVLDVGVISGGVDTFGGNTPTLTAQEYRIGFGYKANNSGVSANGSAITVDSAVTLPTVSQLDVGARAGSSQILNSTIKRFTYWPVRFPDPTLLRITQ